MSILVNKESKVIVQGITGSEGTFHAAQMLEYGTSIVGGVTPGKGGTKAVEGKVDVYNSVEEARKNTKANVSIIFVPPPFAAEAIIEASLLMLGSNNILNPANGAPITRRNFCSKESTWWRKSYDERFCCKQRGRIAKFYHR